MTGLERWASAHQASPQEISILLETENPSHWKDFLGASLDSDEPIPAGRAAALEGLLQRGRAGQIGIPLDVVAAHAGTDAESAARVALEAFPGLVVVPDDDAKPPYIRSHALPALLAKIKDPDARIDPLPAPESAPYDALASDAEPYETPAATDAPEPAAPTPAAKPAPQATKPPKKTKYSITKANVQAALGLSGASLPVREIRTFLLSLPGYKAQDVALMTDEDVLDAFGKD